MQAWDDEIFYFIHDLEMNSLLGRAIGSSDLLQLKIIYSLYTHIHFWILGINYHWDE